MAAQALIDPVAVRAVRLPQDQRDFLAFIPPTVLRLEDGDAIRQDPSHGFGGYVRSDSRTAHCKDRRGRSFLSWHDGSHIPLRRSESVRPAHQNRQDKKDPLALMPNPGGPG
jgi:hypothetical protein